MTTSNRKPRILVTSGAGRTAAPAVRDLLERADDAAPLTEGADAHSPLHALQGSTGRANTAKTGVRV